MRMIVTPIRTRTSALMTSTFLVSVTDARARWLALE
jgi:hypothetical protein